MPTPPLGSSCPSCASLKFQQPQGALGGMEMKDSNASLAASEASSTAWAPAHGNRSVRQFYQDLKQFFTEQGLQYHIGLQSQEKMKKGQTFWFDDLVKETIGLSKMRLHMPMGRPEGHDEALHIFIRAVTEDNWRDIVAYCEKQKAKEEPYLKPKYVFVRKSSQLEWKPYECE